ncbi:hypothetical protein [Methanoplanus endosymbiosus]|uniref:Uncharacterized protein n=1 Tax=Methanoplanus endosymbiosus TaxID=33865 RepID=A0A9E7PSK6_9EURY|nr:hypothetical protein [Methanoplanus endosymbiosus]UUX92962.1 hypothetical protein L6E24_02220 [Methanoplanus endosymbiosus]
MGDWKKAVAVFKEMKFPIDCNRFEEKLAAQKIICMLQLKGMNLNYPFRLNIRGSYSKEFTRDYYNYNHEFKNLITDTTLSEDEKITVNALDSLFKKSPSLLEIGATYAYLTENLGKSPIEAFGIVKQEKGFYPDTKIAKGISKAKEFLFEPTLEDLDWLKEETGPMQRASLKSMKEFK